MQIINEYTTTNNGSQPNSSNGKSHFSSQDVKKAPFSSTSQTEVVDVILRMHSDLVEYGRNRALASGDIEPREYEIAALTAHAEAMANEAYRESYDPQKHEDHKLRESEYKKLQEDRAEAELTSNHAAAEVSDLEEEMAKARSEMKAPVMPQVLMLSAVAGLTLTIAPTLHDYVFITIKDDILNWALSLVSAMTYGIFITWGLLDTDDATGRRTVRNWLGLVGGIGVPVGLGMLRVANATGGAELVFALALTTIEIGIVLLLEARAKTLRVAYQEWAAQQAVLKDIASRLESARTNFARRTRMLKDATDAISAHIRLVEELAVRNFNIEKIKADAVMSVKDGYYSGLAVNRGRTRGIRRADR